MKQKNRFLYFTILMSASLILSCTKKEDPTLPVITTDTVILITTSSATCGGNITSDGGAKIITRGVCWGIEQTPGLTGSKTTDSIGTGSFTSKLTGLSENTTYYVRAYATNSVGTAFGSEKSFTTSKEVQISPIVFNPSISYGSLTDQDGNTYKTVVIGTQTWMAENLKTTKYNDGTAIPFVNDSTAWEELTTGAYCWYNDSEKYKPIGALYNWYALNTGKLCPVGWHIPTDTEWKTLIGFVGDSSANKMKETGITHWDKFKAEVSNESGFTGLPGGLRNIDGVFSNGIFSERIAGFWWSSTLCDCGFLGKNDRYYTSVYALKLSYFYDESIFGTSLYKESGASVRCVKD